MYSPSSLRDALVLVGASGILTHVIFNRTESVDPITLTSLLVVAPGLLSLFLLPFYSLIAAVLITFLTFHIVLLSSIVLYRISPFHPLAKYPGPLLCKVTKWWLYLNAYKGYQFKYLRSLHERYGDVVRIGPNELSINDVSAVTPIMGTHGFVKGPNWTGRTFHTPIPSLIALRSNEVHLERRKPWVRGFSINALKEYQPVITARVTELLDRLSGLKGEVDISEWMGRYSHDIMSDVVFGGGVGLSQMMRDGDKDGYHKIVDDGMSFGTIFDSLPWLAYFARNVPGLGEDVKRMREMGIGKAALRNKQGSKTKDLFYYLSNDDLPEEKKANPAVVIAEGILATVAGSDTTSNALTVALYFLLKNQDAYRRLQAEVDKFYPQGEDPLDSKHYKDMEFLEAVINETLRMYPAVMSGSQRSVMRGQGGKLIGQYYIPEDTQVRIPTYTLHRDPRNFSPYPDTFWPDRWLIAEGRQESKEEIVHQVNAFIPFSFGPANCVGKNLAWTQLRMVLVALLHKFEIKPVKGWDADEWERLITEQYITMRTSLPVILERR